jgi:hypothetical protein
MLSPSEAMTIRVRIIIGEKDWKNKETNKKMEGYRKEE